MTQSICIVDIDECAGNMTVCFPEDNAICTNDIPGFTCGCVHGYIVDSTGLACAGQ